jgi:phytoene synthase
MSELDAAYARCEEITRQAARNFAWGIRLLDGDKRRAMSALYAFARRVDDIGDGPLSVEEKKAALRRVHDEIDELTGATPVGDPVLLALGDTACRYPLPLGALHELVEGCEMDTEIRRYEDFDQLVVYCRCVAGSIGRLSLAIFGNDGSAGTEELADVLGVALQLTNILRDVVEDRDVMGRIYLPAEDLARFGCELDASGPPAGLADLIRFEATRARERYEVGLGLLDHLDRHSKACVSAMAGIYRRLLIRIEREPLAVLERRVSLPGWEKAWVAARSLSGVGA